MIAQKELREYLESLESGNEFRQIRLIAVLSAAIAVGTNDLTTTVLSHLKKIGIADDVIYEAVLQSYLFLGFPRMIEAALAFNEVFGDRGNGDDIERISAQEAENWFRRGGELCRRIYGKNYERLKARFLSISPEMFRWMVLEGYGKVLSRPGLSQIERELAEVAALIVDGRERQLVSHVMGSINVGAPLFLIRQVNVDIMPLAGADKHARAEKIIDRIEKKYASRS
ncbi:MAG: carboxymuconolactone decarboxylase family protein [Candidatus Zixiibacteriota bacterium]|nr:MAG: carboxymuconolactone decarboxylase family protein [candidate division Zixibacteria bacterium]